MRTAITVVFAFLIAGCYSDRMTGSYSSFDELGAAGSSDAIIEESGDDAETIARNEQRLRELRAGQAQRPNDRRGRGVHKQGSCAVCQEPGRQHLDHGGP